MISNKISRPRHIKECVYIDTFAVRFKYDYLTRLFLMNLFASGGLYFIFVGGLGVKSYGKPRWNRKNI